MGPPSLRSASRTTRNDGAAADTGARHGAVPLPTLPPMPPAARATEPAAAAAPPAPAPSALREFARLARLHTVPITLATSIFATYAAADGDSDARAPSLGRVAFACALGGLLMEQTGTAPPDDLARAGRMTDAVFAAFDADGNGRIDFAELAAGLSVMCAGAPDERVRT
jgi:hypothetical protein